MGLKLSKKNRGRSYSFTEKDKQQPDLETPENNGGNGGAEGNGSKKSKRSKSSAAKFSSTRETYVPKSSETPANGNQQPSTPETGLNLAGLASAATAAISSVASDAVAQVESKIASVTEKSPPETKEETAAASATNESSDKKEESSSSSAFTLQNVLESVKHIDPNVDAKKIKEVIKPVVEQAQKIIPESVIEQAEKIIPEPVKEKIMEFIKPDADEPVAEPTKQSEPEPESKVEAKKEPEPVVAEVAKEPESKQEPLNVPESIVECVKKPETVVEQLEKASNDVIEKVIDDNCEKIQSLDINKSETLPEPSEVCPLVLPDPPSELPVLNGDEKPAIENLQPSATIPSQIIESAESQLTPPESNNKSEEQPIIQQDDVSQLISNNQTPLAEESKVEEKKSDSQDAAAESKPEDNQLLDQVNQTAAALLEPALSNNLVSIKNNGTKMEIDTENIIPVVSKMAEQQLTNITNGHHNGDDIVAAAVVPVANEITMVEQNGSEHEPKVPEVPGEIVSL